MILHQCEKPIEPQHFKSIRFNWGLLKNEENQEMMQLYDKNGNQLERSVIREKLDMSLKAKIYDRMWGQTLAIPSFFLRRTPVSFEYVFSNSNVATQCYRLVIYIIAVVFMIKSQLRFPYEWLNIILVMLTGLIGIGILSSLLNAATVTEIKVNSAGAMFSGWFGSTSIHYGDIIGIFNNREMMASASISSSFGFWNMMTFLRGFRVLSWYSWMGSTLDPKSRYQMASEPIDNTPTSSAYMNRISIVTAEKDIEYLFVGAGNQPFIKALAIIIYMSRKHNPNCFIDPKAIRAAEKGEEDFIAWKRCHKLY